MKKDFIEVTPDSGTGDGSVTVAAAPNIGLSRQTSFAVASGDDSKVVTVGQDGLPIYVGLSGTVEDDAGDLWSPVIDNITQETATVGDTEYQYLVYDYKLKDLGVTLLSDNIQATANIYIGYSTYQYFKQLGLDASLPDFNGNSLRLISTLGHAKALNIPESGDVQSGISTDTFPLELGSSSASGSEFTVGLTDTSGNTILIPLAKFRINYVEEVSQVDYTVQIGGTCSGELTNPVTVQIAAVDSESTTVWIQQFTVNSAGALPAPSASVKIDSKYVNTGYNRIVLRMNSAGGPATTYHIDRFSVVVNMVTVLDKMDETITGNQPQMYPLTSPATFTEEGLVTINLQFNEVSA